jgi:3-deoxy-D-arabino-heptulosonate 7-phosphate (DAHP) synthase
MSETMTKDQEKFIEERKELAEVYKRAHDRFFPDIGQCTVFEDALLVTKYAKRLEDKIAHFVNLHPEFQGYFDTAYD